MSRARAIVPILLAAFVSAGCWEQVHSKWFSQMKEQPAVQHLEGVAPFDPPENTIPAGGIVARLDLAPDHPDYQNPMVADSVRDLVNPVEASERSHARGKKMYDVYCGVCHGPQGMPIPALAPVAGKLMAVGIVPLPLSSSAAYTDGQLFTKIRYGRPNMPSYPQIIEEDRWHIVNYLRTMFPPIGG